DGTGVAVVDVAVVVGIPGVVVGNGSLADALMEPVGGSSRPSTAAAGPISAAAAAPSPPTVRIAPSAVVATRARIMSAPADAASNHRRRRVLHEARSRRAAWRLAVSCRPRLDTVPRRGTDQP